MKYRDRLTKLCDDRRVLSNPYYYRGGMPQSVKDQIGEIDVKIANACRALGISTSQAWQAWCIRSKS